MLFKRTLLFIILFCVLLTGCIPATVGNQSAQGNPVFQATSTTPPTETPIPLPTRIVFPPAELVPYIAQNGDTLPAVAAHFNTSVREILAANTFIPESATTLPAGMPMEVPIYYRSFWGSPYQIIPDSYFINGPKATQFDTAEFLETTEGWLKDYSEFAGGRTRNGAEIVDLVATNFSISPRVLLALIEYQAEALSTPNLPAESRLYPLGHESFQYQGVYLQLVWAASILNSGYYGWRSGDLIEFELKDSTIERPDPWQNAATVAFQNFFNQTTASPAQYRFATGEAGIAKTFYTLFGDLWVQDEAHIPGSLVQPSLSLPFVTQETWSYTGGPHTAWGTGAPYSAIDFGPPTSGSVSGCFDTDLAAAAIADGLVVRSEVGTVVLDLDQDGDERTGWVIFYLHLATNDRAQVGDVLSQGDPVGHPSCEGGSSTGTHVHIARKYNGEWIEADSVLPFEMSGWRVVAGEENYEGYLVKFGEQITACTCSDEGSWISKDR